MGSGVPRVILSVQGSTSERALRGLDATSGAKGKKDGTRQILRFMPSQGQQGARAGTRPEVDSGQAKLDVEATQQLEYKIMLKAMLLYMLLKNANLSCRGQSSL